MQGSKQQALKVILSMMLRHGLLKRVKSASFSSPVFLIDKKDPNSLPRLLADVRSLNEHLQGVQQIVPKIQSLLENVGRYKPVLFSTIDLASAFFSMVPDKRTQKALTLSTQFGLFSAQVGVQGVSHIPTLFSDFIHRALHTDQEGNPDPIAFLIGYLDDVLSFSPLSTLDENSYSDLIMELETYSNSEDKNHKDYVPLSCNELITACDHFILNDLIFSRLEFHGFRV